MKYVLTLIAGTARLSHSTVAAVHGALAAAGATPGETEWLAPDRACDIPFEGIASDEAEAGARSALAGQAVDLIAQLAAGRRKKLLVADMESTIIDNEMIDELAGELGLQERMAELTARTMRGELDFAQSLIARVRMLEGLDASLLEKRFAGIKVNPGAIQLVATMRANGAYCALVSGGFTVYSDHVRKLIGFDHAQANRLEVADGKLTGRVAEPVLDRDAKRACLMQMADKLSITPAEAVAVGDGANDLAMVKAAGLGVAYHGKPILAEAADLRVDHGDLTALLYAQGYRAEEFVGG